MSKAISVSTGLIFTIFFSKWKVFAWIFSIRSSFSDYSRDVAMATNIVGKFWQNYLPPALIAPAFRSRLGDHNFYFRRVIGNHWFTVCRNLVTFSSVTAEFSLLKRQFFPRYGKNWSITQNISEYPGPTLTYFTGLIGVLVGMTFQIFVWRSPKGCCYGNQLNMGDVLKRRVEWPLLFASAFDNGWPIINPLSKGSMAIIRLHRVKTWWTFVQ